MAAPALMDLLILELHANTQLPANVKLLLMLSGQIISVSADLDSPKLDFNVSAMVLKLVTSVTNAHTNPTPNLTSCLTLVSARMDTLKSEVSVLLMENNLRMKILTVVLLEPISTRIKEHVLPAQMVA